jgi:hypothetical protein
MKSGEVNADDFGIGALLGALVVGVIWLGCDQIAAALL